MTEERTFWGLGKTPETFKDDPFLSELTNSHDLGSFRVYPVFDSKEKAEKYVREAYMRGTGDIGGRTLLGALDNVQKIKPNDIRSDHDVLLNREKLVKWSKLTGKVPPTA
jgi:hypothetical protein